MDRPLTSRGVLVAPTATYRNASLSWVVMATPQGFMEDMDVIDSVGPEGGGGVGSKIEDHGLYEQGRT